VSTIIQTFHNKKKSSQKITMVTCYDACFAKILEQANIDCLLVGDSLGMVVQGNSSTLTVTLDEIIYHTKMVKRGAQKTFIISDLPFLSYHISIEKAIESAGRLIKETQVDAVKLEGASLKTLQIIKELTEMGVPVMGHLGLTPQSFQILGGYKVQGKTQESKNKIIEEAKKLEEAGCFSIVLEMVPSGLAQEIAELCTVPIIGIGAGKDIDGQVLVLYDLLGMNPNFSPKFLKKYSNLFQIILEATKNYKKEVEGEIFPSEENSF
jgi:3-methyl-2-oxobutanoate hydroxymethyltransferase